MLRRASDKFILASFAVLAVSSLGLKAIAGPPRDGMMEASANGFERRVAGMLHGQDFTTDARHFRYRSTLILATRGRCRLGVRDAWAGPAAATEFERDATEIGRVRYLYRGHSYDQAPAFAMRLGRIETEALSRLGMQPAIPMPVALAASPDCGDGDFGLSDVRI